MRWQDEKTLQDVEKREDNRPDTGFLSWSNYIKKHKQDANKRYEVAQQFLPWPLGFKESVLALRAIIRDKKKANEDYQSELLSLYQLAAWESFCPKQCDKLQQPGFKVFDQTPGGLVTALPVDYKQLGYQHLKLVTKTDAKLLVGLYGEPQQHTTLNQLFQQLWQQAEMDYLQRWQQQQTDVDEPQTQIFQTKSPAAKTDTKTAIKPDATNAPTPAGSDQLPKTKFKSGLTTASNKYDANGQILITSIPATSRFVNAKSKNDLNSDRVASQQAEQGLKHKYSKYFNKMHKPKQLSELLIHALRDRALVKEKVLSGSIENIKQRLTKKRLIALLGTSCLIVTRKTRSK